MGGGITTPAGLGCFRGLIAGSLSDSLGLSFHYTQQIFSQAVSALEGNYDSASGSPIGHELLILDWDRHRPVTWDPIRGRALRPSSAIHFRPLCVAFSIDGDRAAFYDLDEGPDHRVRLIDTGRLVELACPIAAPEIVTALAFDPSGRILAGGDEDHRIRLWDIGGGENLLTLEGHSGPVRFLHFFPNGEALATGAALPDGTTEIFLWRTAKSEMDQAALDLERISKPGR